MSSPGAGSTPEFRVGPDADRDRYVLGVAVGSGAEGILYRGSITTATGVKLEVAIKMLQPRFLSRIEEWHTRWTEQVELLRSLQVPGVVPVRDGFLGPLPHPPGHSGEGQTLYLVMNWVDGESLDEWIRHRPDRDPIDDLKLLVPVAAALDLMHSGQATGAIPIVHRDLKPSNILVTDHGSVLVDFGLTRGLPGGQRLTGVVGTPGYLAPETSDAGIYSPATDCYAFGAVAYFVVTGFEPPTSHQPEALRTLLAAVPALAERPEVVDHITNMLATEPDTRPPGLANWIGQLRRSSLEGGPSILNPPAPRRHPTAPGRRSAGSVRRRMPRRRRVMLLAGALVAALGASALAVDRLGGSSAGQSGVRTLPTNVPTAPPTTSQTTTPPPTTLTKAFNPFDQSKNSGASSGSCWTNSTVVPVPLIPGSAWRCMLPGNEIFDPCFSQSTPSSVNGGWPTSTLSCFTDPWSRGHELNLTQPLPPSQTQSNGVSAPGNPFDWALELANGAHCTVGREMMPIMNRVQMTYVCPRGLAGRLDSSHDPWTVLYNPQRASTLIPVNVTVAWGA